MEHINIAQYFYNKVVSSGKLSLFEDSPAVTIFAPIDGKKTPKTCNPEAYIIGPNFLAYSPDLLPGNNVTTRSGDVISITWAPDGGRLVNGRRLVKANIPIKNGVIHFIDGVCTSHLWESSSKLTFISSHSFDLEDVMGVPPLEPQNLTITNGCRNETGYSCWCIGFSRFYQIVVLSLVKHLSNLHSYYCFLGCVGIGS